MALPRPTHFDPNWYLDAYPDVAAAGMDPLRHYLRFGRYEGRWPCPLVAAARERDLRWRLLEDGPAALEALLEVPARPERVWAAIALARWAADADDWTKAHALLSPLCARDDLVCGFGLSDPALLAIEAAVAVGDASRADDILAAAWMAFGRTTDLALAAANLTALKTGFDRNWRRILATPFRRRAMVAPRLGQDEGRSAFDRLETPPIPPIPVGPLVSVIVPARNAAKTIGTALDGLLKQSWRRLEILVVENGSTDDTSEIIRAAARRDPRIRPIDGSDDPGAYPARNRGLTEARGAFVTIHDADDWSHPSRIARQVATLIARPWAMASIAHWSRVTPGMRFTRWWGNDGHLHPAISTLMLRRRAIQSLGFWDRVHGGADTEYHDRLQAAFGPRAVAPTAPGVPLAFGRRTAGSLSRAGMAGIETRHRGPRAEYDRAAAAWHAGAVGADLHLTAHPAARPFPVPKALSLPNPPPTAPPQGPQARLTALSGFDADWMLRSYPDLRISRADPAAYWLARGATEGRAPGPRYIPADTAHGADPLEEMERHGAAPRLPDLNGAQPAMDDRPTVLIFGHQAGRQIFGAERSLLDMLDRAWAAGCLPSVVLPQALDPVYLEAVRARSHRVHLRPYGWRYGGTAPPTETLDILVDLIRQSGAVAVHQNTLVLEAPLRAARLAGVPAIVHVRELPAEDAQLCRDLGTFPEALRQDLLRGADAFIANSHRVAHWLNAPDRTIIAPNRIDPTLLTLPASPADPPRVALIGSLEPRKGLLEVLALARACPDLSFRLIGPASAALAASQRSWPPNVAHAGYAPDPAAAMAQTDIVLSLSRFAESWGRTVSEALAAGRPVLTWDRGMPPDLTGRDGTAGIVVPAGDVPAAAAALRTMAKRDALIRLSHGARARARTLMATDPLPETVWPRPFSEPS